MGNFEIQAKIDIERHPEWREWQKERHLKRAQEKDVMQARKDFPNKVFISSLPLNGYRAQSFFIDETEPFTLTYDEPHWYDAQPIISPNVFRTEVLGNVRI